MRGDIAFDLEPFGQHALGAHHAHACIGIVTVGRVVNDTVEQILGKLLRMGKDDLRIALAGLGGHPRSENAAGFDFHIVERGEIDPAAEVVGDAEGPVGETGPALLERDHVGPRSTDRQGIAEIRHFANGRQTRTRAGAIEPVMLAIDGCADDDMVEGTRKRLRDRDCIAIVGVHQHRFRIDVHLVQHRHQKHRLGLAVAIAQRPGFGRRLRQVIAAVHAVHEVVDFVLHRAQRHGGAGQRIGARRADTLDFGGQRTAGRDRALGAIMRGHHRRDIGPIIETADLDRRLDLIASGRIVRHLLDLVDREDQLDRSKAPGIDDGGCRCIAQHRIADR